MENSNKKPLSKAICKITKKLKKQHPVVAVARLNGVIGKVSMSQGMTLNSIKYVDKISKINNLKAIILIINSPGGSPVQSELISKKITSVAKSYNKDLPIITFCEDVAASGGYWLACMGDEIYASNSSIIGSIGVISQGFGFVETIKKLGIERRIYTQGKNKSVLDPFSEIKKSDLEIISHIQKDVHQSFIDYVRSQRKTKLQAKDDEIFNGKFWSGKQAKQLGLIDGIGYYEDIIKDKFGPKTIFKEVSSPKGFLQKKLSTLVNLFSNEISVKIDEAIISSKFKL